MAIRSQGKKLENIPFMNSIPKAVQIIFLQVDRAPIKFQGIKLINLLESSSGIMKQLL